MSLGKKKAAEVAEVKEPVNQAAPKGLTFKSVDLGEFDFFKFEKEGDTFTGTYEGPASELNESIEGLHFKDLEGNSFVISTYYRLVKYFENADNLKAGRIFKITFKGKKKADKGEVSVFGLEYADQE